MIICSHHQRFYQHICWMLILDQLFLLMGSFKVQLSQAIATTQLKRSSAIPNVFRRPFTILPFQVNLRFVLLSTKRKTRSNSPKTQSDNFYVWLSENIALLGHDLLPVILYRMTTAHTAIYVMFKIMFKIISESWKIPPLLDRRGDRINYLLPKIVVSFHPLVVNPGHKKAC